MSNLLKARHLFELSEKIRTIFRVQTEEEFSNRFHSFFSNLMFNDFLGHRFTSGESPSGGVNRCWQNDRTIFIASRR